MAQQQQEQHHPERSENAILVSWDKRPYFYVNMGKKLMTGREDRPAQTELIITGLGVATKTAIGAAFLLEKENCVTIYKVETSYFPGTKPQKRMIPKIAIICRRTPEFAATAASERAAAEAAAKEREGVVVIGTGGN